MPRFSSVSYSMKSRQCFCSSQAVFPLTRMPWWPPASALGSNGSKPPVDASRISLAPDPTGKALRPASHRASQPVPAPTASPNRSGFDGLAAALRREARSPLDGATIPLAAVLRVHGVPLSELLTPRSDLKSLADARDDFTGGPIEGATEDAEGPLH